jgi:hypothetical protein
MSVRDYHQLKFGPVTVARHTADPESRKRRERLRRRLARPARGCLRPVVVGCLRRGKASLLNALFATDRLPGIRSPTAVVATVTYGPNEHAVIHPVRARPPDCREQPHRRGIFCRRLTLS